MMFVPDISDGVLCLHAFEVEQDAFDRPEVRSAFRELLEENLNYIRVEICRYQQTDNPLVYRDSLDLLDELEEKGNQGTVGTLKPLKFSEPFMANSNGREPALYRSRPD